MVKRKSGGIYQGRNNGSDDYNNLFKRGNYSMLRLLTIINASVSQGITTRRLLDTVGSHGTYLQKALDRAEELGLIERVTGESEHGKFPMIHNTITDRGRKLLRSQFFM